MRAKVNLTLDSDLANEARELGLNMSRLAEAAIADAAKLERNRRWCEENREALNAYALEVEENGLPLAEHRTF
ncbi:MAG: type II toxin-antitoxin system CcdA family antitoxin [Cohaesibacter sp.]|nr:type II toxin-antitoxin system CcdA family antitoxin [Cohaesibacter sp.]MCV6600160.1 type II toxin-antitoxin system CcdA family antitoxin [Cohaesibacter sp.]